MVTHYTPSQTISDVYGVVGTGVSLGVLTGMAGMTMRSAERMSGYGYGYRPYRARRKTSVKRESTGYKLKPIKIKVI